MPKGERETRKLGSTPTNRTIGDCFERNGIILGEDDFSRCKNLCLERLGDLVDANGTHPEVCKRKHVLSHDLENELLDLDGKPIGDEEDIHVNGTYALVTLCMQEAKRASGKSNEGSTPRDTSRQKSTPLATSFQAMLTPKPNTGVDPVLHRPEHGYHGQKRRYHEQKSEHDDNYNHDSKRRRGRELNPEYHPNLEPRYGAGPVPEPEPEPGSEYEWGSERRYQARHGGAKRDHEHGRNGERGHKSKHVHTEARTYPGSRPEPKSNLEPRPTLKPKAERDSGIGHDYRPRVAGGIDYTVPQLSHQYAPSDWLSRLDLYIRFVGTGPKRTVLVNFSEICLRGDAPTIGGASLSVFQEILTGELGQSGTYILSWESGSCDVEINTQRGLESQLRSYSKAIQLDEFGNPCCYYKLEVKETSLTAAVQPVESTLIAPPEPTVQPASGSVKIALSDLSKPVIPPATEFVELSNSPKPTIRRPPVEPVKPVPSTSPTPVLGPPTESVKSVFPPNLRPIARPGLNSLASVNTVPDLLLPSRAVTKTSRESANCQDPHRARSHPSAQEQAKPWPSTNFSPLSLGSAPQPLDFKSNQRRPSLGFMADATKPFPFDTSKQSQVYRSGYKASPLFHPQSESLFLSISLRDQASNASSSAGFPCMEKVLHDHKRECVTGKSTFPTDVADVNQESGKPYSNAKGFRLNSKE